jgi:hypothetical protein
MTSQKEHQTSLWPTGTDELVERLKNRVENFKEVLALQALCSQMITIFEDTRPLYQSYVPEAAKLSCIATAKTYDALFHAFSNHIISGTNDGSVLGEEVLSGFNKVLHCQDSLKGTRQLGPVMDSLQRRLQSSISNANQPQAKYNVLHMLCGILDAMNEIKTKGISRLKIHDPLLDQLKSLSNDDDLRIAQAARYAFQALLHIPNDEGPWKALWRHASTAVGAAANVAASISTLDPTKLWSALSDDVPTLISAIPKVMDEISKASDGISTVMQALNVSRRKRWYLALRYTDLLVRSKAFEDLETLLGVLRCRYEEEFLCGLCAQLEEAWQSLENIETDKKGIILRIVECHLLPARANRKNLQGWIRLVSGTFQQSQWGDGADPAHHYKFALWNRNKKQKRYPSNVSCWKAPEASNQSPLLAKAWAACVEAHAIYADIAVCRHYLSEEKKPLHVNRLSGKLLPMKQCYINLATVQRPEGQQGSSSTRSGNTTSPFSLAERLGVKEPSTDAKVALPTLFKKRQSDNGKPRNRVLIRGQAGIGKSTLCKKMVHDYVHGLIWGTRFDRVLWLPLRRLKYMATRPPNQLEQVFVDEFFGDINQQDAQILATALSNIVQKNSDRSRTLFILDGLDEVSAELNLLKNLGTHKERLLPYLLNQRSVIITSRPHGIDPASLEDIHLDLEVVGFYPDQVNEYIWKNEPVKANDIQQFIREHELLQSLARIPIQLEALCYSFESGVSLQTYTPNTMTALYKTIERPLWEKDIPSLPCGKSLEGRDVKGLNEIAFRRQIQDELNFLQAIAFAGLCKNIMEFRTQDPSDPIMLRVDDIKKNLPAPQNIAGAFVSTDLAKLSFVRTSDPSADNPNRKYHYHFLHLTFQEYFAAQFFVEHWISGKHLPYLGVRSNEEVEELDPEVFLQREKYNNNFDIFWRFVSGLLQTRGDSKGRKALCRLFNAFQDEPRDLLGPRHLRLLIRCMSEVDELKEPNLFSAREQVNEKLFHWLCLNCVGRCETAGLICDMEFPELVLKRALEQGTQHGLQMGIFLKKLRDRPRFLGLCSVLASWLQKAEDDGLILELLSRHRNLSRDVLAPVISVLTDAPNDGLKKAALRVLWVQSEMPKEIIRRIWRWCFGLGKDDLKPLTSSFLRTFLVMYLGAQPGLPGDVRLEGLEKIEPLLRHGDPLWSFDALCMAPILGSHISRLPDDLISSLISLAGNSYAFSARANLARRNAAKATWDYGNRGDWEKWFKIHQPSITFEEFRDLAGHAGQPSDTDLQSDDEVENLRSREQHTAESIVFSVNQPPSQPSDTDLQPDDEVENLRSREQHAAESMVFSVNQSPSQPTPALEDLLRGLSDLKLNDLATGESRDYFRQKLEPFLATNSEETLLSLIDVSLRFTDGLRPTKWNMAAQIIRSQKTLSHKVFSALVDILEHEDDTEYPLFNNGSWGRDNPLTGRADMPDKISSRIARIYTRLTLGPPKNYAKENYMESVLDRHEGFSHLLLSLDNTGLEAFYLYWLKRSAKEPVSWSRPLSPPFII